MTDSPGDHHRITQSIEAFVLRVSSIMKQEDVFFRLHETRMECLINTIHAKGRGVSLELQIYGSLYVGVEQIEADSFFDADGNIVPGWMTA